MGKPRLYPWAIGAFFALFMVFPLAHVLSRAFFADGKPSLHFFLLMFEAEHFREVLFNSLNIAIAVTLLSTFIAYPIAMLFARFRLPFANTLHAVLLLPLVVPPFVGVLGVRQLFSRFGSVNVFLLDHGFISEPINWLGGGNVFGIIGLQVVHLVPILYMSISASLQTAHISLEEAALMSGASRWRALTRIILPLSLPGWFAGATLVFIASFTDLGTPLIFEYRRVISVQIYNMLSDLHENPVGYSFVVFTCMLCITLFCLSKASMMGGSFTGSGRAREGRLQRPLPRSLVIAVLPALLLYCTVAIIPQAVVVLLALSKEWFMSVLPQQWTLSHFAEVIHHKLTARSLIISFSLSIAASVLTVVIGFLTAYLVTRGRGPSRVVFEMISITPLAIPGIVFAFGYIGAFSGTPLDNRINPFPLLIAAYAVRRMPAMVRSAYAGLQEASVSLEEAGFMAGASPFKVARRIVLPLMSSHLIVGAMLTFAYSMIEVSDSLLLALEAQFYPVSKAIYSLMGRPDGIELASALGCVVMAIMLICFYLAESIARRASSTRALKGLILCALVGAANVARAETDEIVAVSPHWEGIRTEFGDGFAREWKARTGRDVVIRWQDIGGTSDIVKYIKTQFKQTPKGIGIDLFFGGGVDSFIELQRFGLLQSADVSDEVLRQIPPSLAGVVLRDPNREWFANAISTFGILYNKVAVQRLGLPIPERWGDLADDRYFDLVGAADPRKSGSMHAMFEIMLQGYGWDEGWRLLRRFGRNVRVFSASASQIGKEVATGEVVYGLAIDTYAGDIIRLVGEHRLGYILPSDYASINGDGLGVLRGAPNHRAASAFVEFILSEEGQMLWLGKRGAPGGPQRFELGKLPVLPSVYGKVPAATLFDINPFTISYVLGYNADLAAGRWNLFNDLFGAFVLNVHDRLARAPNSTSLGGIPVSENDSRTLSQGGAWGANSSERSALLKEWEERARVELPVEEPLLDRLRWVPGTLLGCLLLLAIMRRLLRVF